MFRRVFSVHPAAWLILAITMVIAVSSLVSRSFGLISPAFFLYVVQPALAFGNAAVVYFFVRGRNDRIRQKTDKALMVGSVLAIWFVVYLSSGLAVTYVHNAVVSSVYGVIVNLLSYGSVAVCFEYARHGTLMLAGRRNVVWFGSLVMIAFALQQMNLSGLADAHTAEDAIKLVISDFVPVIVSSMVLTYLSFSSGLPSQLTYRLGMVAMTLLPPFIPKYDWYMTGVSAVLLAVIIYAMVDRSQHKDEYRHRERKHHTRLAFDTMFVALMTVMVLFVSGIFSYKPVVIMSDSMVPVFSRGSVVVVQKIGNPMDIRVGDIIQYESDNKTITHRVVAIMEAKDEKSGLVFTTKGDNSPSQDAPVSRAQVMGVVRSTVPYIGFPTVWLKELSVKH